MDTLDEGTLQEAIESLQRVGAALNSNNDPAVLQSYIQPPSTITMVLISIGLAVVAIILAQVANYREIQRNWAHYRCEPSVSPFAKFYGYDLAETLNFCMSEAVREHAGGVIDPIYQGINKVTGVVDGVYNQVQSIAGGVEGLLKGFRDFVMNFINSMGLIGTRIRMSIIRMKDIFGRVYGLFIAFAYAAISALTFGENLICNPLVVFLGTITGVDVCCFAPDTQIIMADGVITKPITQIRIGDCLGDGAVVESTYMFSGEDTKMCRLFGVHVSANHYVLAGKQMIQVGEHCAATDAETLPRLWCLGTSTHRIPVQTGDMHLTFADYEESSDPAVIAETQRIAEMELNKNLTLDPKELVAGSYFPRAEVAGSCFPRAEVAGPTVPDYGLGLDPSFHVNLANGSWVPITNVRIDDALMGGGIVKGVIKELCETQVKTPGGHWVSAAQLILYEGKWQRAANIWPMAAYERETIMYHLMVTANASITIRSEEEVFIVRDYAELTSLAVQAPYDKALKVDSTHMVPPIQVR